MMSCPENSKLWNQYNKYWEEKKNLRFFRDTTSFSPCHLWIWFFTQIFSFGIRCPPHTSCTLQKRKIAIEDGVHKVVNVLHQAHIKDHALGVMKLGTIAPWRKSSVRYTFTGHNTSCVVQADVIIFKILAKECEVTWPTRGMVLQYTIKVLNLIEPPHPPNFDLTYIFNIQDKGKVSWNEDLEVDWKIVILWKKQGRQKYWYKKYTDSFVKLFSAFCSGTNSLPTKGRN